MGDPYTTIGVQDDLTVFSDKATVGGSSEDTLLKTGLPETVGPLDLKQEIEKGITLLDAYTVLSDAIKGGMGKVFKVHHIGWAVDLALKQPHAHFFETDKQKQDFIDECDAWIELGLHPHIVACYYVRQVGGIPSIFSEWMEGGSLRDWICDGRLYEGAPEQSLERILDIAIQYARGLEYAHSQGLIHQDVKPDNVLMDAKGIAKVADFGIAQARLRTASLPVDKAASSQAQSQNTDETMLSASGVYTPAYCSPEQMSGREITYRTDIYSWAITVLEMLLGDHLWQNGVVAGAACGEYLAMCEYVIPDSLSQLLHACLQQEENLRPHDFGSIKDRLFAIYENAVGKEYPRKEEVLAAEGSVENINNRALSYLDLGLMEKAEELLLRAVEKNPSHPDAAFNKAMFEWRYHQKDIRSTRETLEHIHDNNGCSDHAKWLIGNFFLENMDQEQALKWFSAIEQQENYSGIEKYLSLPKNALSAKVTLGKIPFGSFLHVINNGRCLVLKDHETGAFNTWSIPDLSPCQGFETPLEHMDQFAVDPQGKYAMGSKGCEVVLWELASGKMIYRWLDEECVNATIKKLGFTAKGRKAFVVWGKITEDTTRLEIRIEFHDSGHLAKGEGADSIEKIAAYDWLSMRAPKEHLPKQAILISPEGLRVALFDGQETFVYDLGTAKLIRRYEWVDKICSSPSGHFYRHLPTGGYRSLWDDVAGEPNDAEHENTASFTQEEFFGDSGHYLFHWERRDNEAILSKELLSLRDRHTGQQIYSVPCATPEIGTSGKTCRFVIVNVLEHPSKDYSLAFASSGELTMLNYPNETIYKPYWSLSRFLSTQESIETEELSLRLYDSLSQALRDGEISKSLSDLEELHDIAGIQDAARLRELDAAVGRYCRRKDIRTVTKGTPLVEKSRDWKDVRVSPDGRFIATETKCIDTNTGESCALSPADLRCFSEDERFLLMVQSYRETIKARLWERARISLVNAETCQVAKEIQSDIKGEITAIALSPDNTKIAWSAFARNEKGTGLYVWDQVKNRMHTKIDGIFLYGLVFTLDPHLIWGIGLDGLYRWDILKQTCTQYLLFEEKQTSSENRGMTPRMSSDGRFIAYRDSQGKTVVVRDIASKEKVCELRVRADKVLFSDDSRFLFTFSAQERDISIWTIGGRLLSTTPTFEGEQNFSRTHSSFSVDGNKGICYVQKQNTESIERYHIGYRYDFPGWTDWDNDAEWIVERRIALESQLQKVQQWTDDHHKRLMEDLQIRGFGYLSAEGVRLRTEHLLNAEPLPFADESKGGGLRGLFRRRS